MKKFAAPITETPEAFINDYIPQSAPARAFGYNRPILTCPRIVVNAFPGMDRSDQDSNFCLRFDQPGHKAYVTLNGLYIAKQ